MNRRGTLTFWVPLLVHLFRGSIGKRLCSLSISSKSLSGTRLYKTEREWIGGLRGTFSEMTLPAFNYRRELGLGVWGQWDG